MVHGEHTERQLNDISAVRLCVGPRSVNGGEGLEHLVVAGRRREVAGRTIDNKYGRKLIQEAMRIRIRIAQRCMWEKPEDTESQTE